MADAKRLLRLARLAIRYGKRWEASHYQSPHDRRRLERLRKTFEEVLQRSAERHVDNRTGEALRRLLRDNPKLWTFLRTTGVPMTNNAAERMFRPCVIWRKISFFCQSHRGNQFRPMLLSLIETCKRSHINSYQTLRTICHQELSAGKVSFRLPFPDQVMLPSP